MSVVCFFKMFYKVKLYSRWVKGIKASHEGSGGTLRVEYGQVGVNFGKVISREVKSSDLTWSN